MMGEKGYVLPMADIFWKAVAAFAFIGVMTALRFGLSWGYDLMNPLFAAGLSVGAISATALFLILTKLESRGWFR